MPEIDVIDCLLDPDLAADSFVVLRRADVVAANGRTTPVVTDTIPVIGAVYPTGDLSLTRADAYQSQAKTIKVISPFRLRGVAKDTLGLRYQPDIVIWRGDKFLVRIVDDYSRYGAGMVEAECSSIDFADLPPGELAPWVGIADFSRPANSGLIVAFQPLSQQGPGF
jgi:galactose-6-phosphate isomerase